MKYLALDIGTRRTGIAYADSGIGIVLPLDTFSHTTQEQLIAHVMELIRGREIDRVFVGLPLLPSGVEGAQAAISRAAGAEIAKAGIPVEYVDERYSSPKTPHHKNVISASNYDGDAAAACAILSQKMGC